MSNKVTLFKNKEFKVYDDKLFYSSQDDSETEKIFNLSEKSFRNRYVGIFSIKSEYEKCIEKLNEQIGYNIGGTYLIHFKPVKSETEDMYGIMTNGLIGYLEDDDTVTLLLDQGFVPGSEGMFYIHCNKVIINKKMINSINYVNTDANLVTLYRDSNDKSTTVSMWYRNYTTNRFDDLHKKLDSSLNNFMTSLREYKNYREILNKINPEFVSSEYAVLEYEVMNNISSEIDRLMKYMKNESNKTVKQ